MSGGGGDGKGDSGEGNTSAYGGAESNGGYTPPEPSNFVNYGSPGLGEMVGGTGADSSGGDTGGGYEGGGAPVLGGSTGGYDTGGGFSVPDFGSGVAGGGGGVPAGDYSGDGGDLPPNALPTGGDTPPQYAALTNAANVAGPAGTGSAPDMAQLYEAARGDEPGGGDAIGDTGPVGSPGPSAAGIAPYTVGGTGSTDLSSARREKPGGGSDDNWLTSLGIKNPLGTAVAAGALGYNMLKGQTQPQPVQDLSKLAADLRATTTGPGGITPEGRAIATTGATNLNTRAAELSPLTQDLQNRGAGLTKYVGTGTLPPEMQTQVDQAARDAKTARMSFYASRGMPTDPALNTALRSDLEGIDRQAVIMASTMASDLAKTGTSIADTGIRSNQLAGGFEKSAGDIGTSMVNSGLQASGLQSQAYAQLAQIDAAQTARTQAAIEAMAKSLSGGPQVTNLRLT